MDGSRDRQGLLFCESIVVLARWLRNLSQPLSLGHDECRSSVCQLGDKQRYYY